MEGLSGAASVIAVASIAMQLADGLEKLYTFWKSVKDAPANVRATAVDSKLLSNALIEIASEAQHGPPNNLLATSLHECRSQLQELLSIVQDLEPGLASKKSLTWTRTAVKSVLKTEKFRKYQELLGSLKSTLILILETDQKRQGRIGFQRLDQRLITMDGAMEQRLVTMREDMEQRLMTIGEGLAARHIVLSTETAQIVQQSASGSANPIQAMYASESTEHQSPNIDELVPQSAGARWLPKTIMWNKKLCFEDTSHLGSLRITSQRLSLQSIDPESEATSGEQHHYEYRTSYVLFPPQLLRNLGFRRALQFGLTYSSVGGWMLPTLNPYNTVPENSPIFAFCESGDIAAVRSLFIKGKASVRDVDLGGRTPLFFALRSVQPKMYRFLINAGAEETLLLPKTQPRSRVEHPLQMTMMRWRHTSIKLEDIVDLLRTFKGLVDFDVDASGWKLLNLWAFGHDPRFDRRGPEEILFLTWLLHFFSTEFEANFHSRNCKMLLVQLLGWPEAFDCFFEKGPTNDVDAAGPPEEYTILQQAIAAGCSYSVVLKHSPNLHIVRLDHSLSPRPETPTSLAMYSARGFQQWKLALSEMNVNIERFIDEELQQSPLRDAGWTKDGLRRLFDYEIPPSIKFVAGNSHHCPIARCSGGCGATHHWFPGIKVQPYWRLILDLIKSGDTTWKSREEGLHLAAQSSGDHQQGASEPMNSIDQERSPVYKSMLFKAIQRHVQTKPPTLSACDDDSPYEKHEVFCMTCWLYYEKTGELWGLLKYRLAREEVNRIEDEAFSPFLIHLSSDTPAPKPATRYWRPDRSEFGDTDFEQAIEKILSGQRGPGGHYIDFF